MNWCTPPGWTPKMQVRPAAHQVDDVLQEIRLRVEGGA